MSCPQRRTGATLQALVQVGADGEYVCVSTHCPFPSNPGLRPSPFLLPPVSHPALRMLQCTRLQLFGDALGWPQAQYAVQASAAFQEAQLLQLYPLFPIVQGLALLVDCCRMVCVSVQRQARAQPQNEERKRKGQGNVGSSGASPDAAAKLPAGEVASGAGGAGAGAGAGLVNINVMRKSRAAERDMERSDAHSAAQTRARNKLQGQLRWQAGTAAVVGIEICLLILQGTQLWCGFLQLCA